MSLRLTALTQLHQAQPAYVLKLIELRRDYLTALGLHYFQNAIARQSVESVYYFRIEMILPPGLHNLINLGNGHAIAIVPDGGQGIKHVGHRNHSGKEWYLDP